MTWAGRGFELKEPPTAFSFEKLVAFISRFRIVFPMAMFKMAASLPDLNAHHMHVGKGLPVSRETPALYIFQTYTAMANHR